MIKVSLMVLALGAFLWFRWSDAPLRSPSGLLARQDPEQIPLTGALPPVSLQGWTLKPLAIFTVEGRVLGKKHYTDDFPAPIAPYDLALGWGPMSDTATLEKLDISQSSRCYHWRYWGTSPLPEEEIVRHSANMHLIPADEAIAEKIAALRTDTVVKMTGYLVEATHPAGSQPWRSSLSRDDTGLGACEIIYVKSVADR